MKRISIEAKQRGEEKLSPSRVTIRDVAARAGVSHQTVSRVINKSKRVRPETKARVESAIDALGFRPNAMARSMARGRSGVLACISHNLTDYTFASIIEGAENEARRQGYFLLSASAPDEKAFMMLSEELASSRRSEGMLVISPYVHQRYVRHLERYPLVFVGAHPKNCAISSVGIDDTAVGRQATQYLLTLGHTKIGSITGPAAESCASARLLGFRSALELAGLPECEAPIVEGDWSAQSGYDALMSMAQVGRIPTGLFVQNDLMAVGAMRAARELGLQIPQQLSIIGIDDIPLASFVDPPMTTFRQEFKVIGREAIRQLIRAIKRPSTPHQQLRISAKMVVRRSTSPKTTIAARDFAGRKEVQIR